jgi:hypothetical protein
MPAFYIVLEKEIPNTDISVNGNLLSKNSEALEQMAKQLGVETLMGFFSASLDEIASLMEVDVDSIKRNPKYQEKWFAAEDGLRTVNTLLENLFQFKMAEPDRVEADLREFAQVLELAKSNGIRWHLAIDY